MTFKGAGHGPEKTFVSSFFMQNTILEIRQAISFAAFCRTQGREREAIGVMHTVIRSLHTIKKISPQQFINLKELAIREISNLWYSTDDYVWEEASEMLSSLQLF